MSKSAETEAATLLVAAGYAVIAPNGDCLGNVGLFPDGSMVISTKRKPIYGLLSVHPVSPGDRVEP